LVFCVLKYMCNFIYLQSKRIVSDINYDIDEEMIERYYGNLEPLQIDSL
jgi:hypothetical protein